MKSSTKIILSSMTNDFHPQDKKLHFCPQEGKEVASSIWRRRKIIHKANSFISSTEKKSHPSIHPSIHEDHILEILMCFMLMDTELWFCASQNQSHPVFILSLGLLSPPIPSFSGSLFPQCKEILLNLSMKC